MLMATSRVSRDFTVMVAFAFLSRYPLGTLPLCVCIDLYDVSVCFVSMRGSEASSLRIRVWV